MAIFTQRPGWNKRILREIPCLFNKNPGTFIKEERVVIRIISIALLFSVDAWIKGAGGQTCNEVCGAVGKICNSQMQSSLTTNEKVRDAFEAAGYTCRSYGPPRSYPGAPFSTGRAGDDCFPFGGGVGYSAGHSNHEYSVCDENPFSNHSPLCYCTEGNYIRNKRGDRSIPDYTLLPFPIF